MRGADQDGEREAQAVAARTAFGTCLAYLRAKDVRAAALVDDLLARFPDFAEGWEDLGEALLDAGQSDAAMVALTRALRAAPTPARALRCGLVFRQAGRLAESRGAYQIAVELAPRSARAWFGLALCDQDLGNLAAAIEGYRRAVACEPDVAEAHVNLGTVLQAAGDLDAAKAAYGRALAIRADTFGRIAQALAAEPRGELWLDLGQFRASLRARGSTRAERLAIDAPPTE